MSTHLAFFPDSIPLGYTILQTQNALVGNLTNNGWQLLAQSDGAWSDVIPPATETIGTATFREVVRIYFPNNTEIKIGSYQVCIADAFPQAIRLTAKTAGAVQAGVTIDGVAVLGAAGSAGSTANDNLQALYYALCDSANATIQGWDYVYNGSDAIIATRKTIGASVTCSGNANVNYFVHADPVLAGRRSGYATCDATYAYGVTMDLTNGFIYYMEVDSRSFRLGTKCLTGVYGEIFASYVDHAEALAVVPDSPNCTPIELVIGKSNDGNATALVRLTHWWGIPFADGYHSNPDISTTAAGSQYTDTTPDWHPFTGSANKMAISDVNMDAGYSGITYVSAVCPEITVGKLGLNGTYGNLDGFRVCPLGTMGVSFDVPSKGSTRFCAGLNLSDIFKWSGTEPNETCAWAAVPQGMADAGYTIQQAMDATTDYPTLTLNTTTGLPTSGSLQLRTEKISYTGISGATITGCTRAVDGTTKVRHFTGEAALPGQWFLKVNRSALLCGVQKPF
jgi:hypothetical protein